MNFKIWLSSPHIGANELQYVNEAFATNWIAPLGPHVNAFEHGLQFQTKSSNAAALSSGTSAIHLALILLGVLAYLLKDVTRENPQKSGNLFDANYYNDKGNSLIIEKKFDDAVTDFNKAIELSKNTPQFYVSYSGRAIAKYNLKDCVILI